MHKTDGAGHVDNMFVAEDALLSQPPTEITAEWLNAVQMEIVNVVQWAGFPLNKLNNGQLLQALQAKFASLDPGGDYASKAAVQADTYKAATADVAGSADAIIAAFTPAIDSLASADGMTLYVRARAANMSTTPTFTPNDGVIAAKTIVKGNDLPLAPGDIPGDKFWAELRFDAALDKWVLVNPATGVSCIKLSDFTTNRVLAPSGRQPLPGGFLMQWGTAAVNIPANSGINVGFPIAFPNQAFFVLPSFIGIDDATDCSPSWNALTNVGFRLINNITGGTAGYAYLAFGN